MFGKQSSLTALVTLLHDHSVRSSVRCVRVETDMQRYAIDNQLCPYRIGSRPDSPVGNCLVFHRRALARCPHISVHARFSLQSWLIAPLVRMLGDRARRRYGVSFRREPLTGSHSTAHPLQGAYNECSARWQATACPYPMNQEARSASSPGETCGHAPHDVGHARLGEREWRRKRLWSRYCWLHMYGSRSVRAAGNWW
jgi:hypothetical protein